MTVAAQRSIAPLCHLCLEMHRAAGGRAYFQLIQSEWLKEEGRRRGMIRGDRLP